MIMPPLERLWLPEGVAIELAAEVKLEDAVGDDRLLVLVSMVLVINIAVG